MSTRVKWRRTRSFAWDYVHSSMYPGWRIRTDNLFSTIVERFIAGEWQSVSPYLWSLTAARRYIMREAGT